MIRVTDMYDLVPELFDAYPRLVKVEIGDVDILPVSVPESRNKSTNFTVFIQPEPNMNCNHTAFADCITARPNHIFAVSGFDAVKHQDWVDPYILNFSNLTMTVRFNRALPTIEIDKKQFSGILLLGGWSTMRSILLREIVNAGARDKFLVSYFNRSMDPDRGAQDSDLFYRSPMLEQFDSKEFVNTVFDGIDSGNTCRPAQAGKYGQHHWVSQIIPYNVYNNGYINIVAETESTNTAFFISEKIAKPIILGQPFIVYGGYRYLHYLRELGFKTFDRWIDESYDFVKNFDDRAKAVAHSAIKFSNQPESQQLQSLGEMKEVLDHNRQLILDNSWTMKTIADAIITGSV